MFTTVTKSTVIDRLHNELGFSKREAGELLDMFLEEVAMTLEKGEPVSISAFGQFRLLDKNERPGRNPVTGESVLVTARRVVAFKPSKVLKRTKLRADLNN